MAAESFRTVGALLRRHRVQAGLTQDELAARAGLGPRTVRDIEGGRVRVPRYRSVAALSAALALSDADRRELRTILAAVCDGRVLGVGVLGPLSVSRGGRAVDAGPPLRRDLLGLLALRSGHVVPFHEIIDVLWGERPPKTCATLVHVHIAKLRCVLEPQRAPRSKSQAIVLTGGGYLLDGESVQVDLAQFDRHTAHARQALETGEATRAFERFEEALRCWRGPVLAAAAARLRQHPDAVAAARRRVTTAMSYADVAFEIGRPGQVTAMLRTLVEQEPLHEGLHARLMLALAGSGEQAAALRLYTDLRERLRDELGTEPDGELRATHLRVLRGQIPAVGSTTVAGGIRIARRVRRPAQLPADPVAFVGRRDQLRRLDALLASRATGHPNVAVISGTAGVGKSALAVHWAHLVTDRFTDGQLHVNLRGFDPSASPMAAGDAVRLFLDALEVPPQRVPADLDAQLGLYRSLIAGRRILLVLDNARDADQVRPLLPGSPHCLALITSRNDLTGLVAAEGACPVVLDPLSAAEARQLLDQRLGPGRVAAEPAAAEEVIVRCAHLPLALVIVAARAATDRGLPLAALAAQLCQAKCLDALTADDLVTDLRAVFSWSYRTASPAAARLFRLLGLHPGPDVGVPAVASLVGIPLVEAHRLLGELTRGHLLAEASPGRFGFHDLLRAYAVELTERVDSDTERQAATHRMLDHFLHTGHRAALLLEPNRVPLPLTSAVPGVVSQQITDHSQALRWFTAEHAVLLAVLGRASSAGFDTHTEQLAWTLTDFLQRQGHWRDQATIHRAALHAARRRRDVLAQARAHRHLGRASTLLGDYSEAHTQYRHAITLSGEVGDLAGQAHTHLNMANTAGHEGDAWKGLHHAQQALELFHGAGNQYGQAICLNTIGWFCALTGNPERALTCCHQALTLLRDLGDHSGQAVTLDSVGFAHHQLGQYSRAVEWYRQSLALFTELGDRYYQAAVLRRLGDTHLAAGDPAAARDAWHRALDIFDQLGHPEATTLLAKIDALDEPGPRTAPQRDPRQMTARG
jgi:DNA-binding SARP family transcriptional activator/tetratricopeptide (TPR) repeat protein/DNA-binding XRE family transcriptional regulator